MPIIQPLDTGMEQEIAAKGGTIEFCLYNPRSKTGMRSWEVKIKNTAGLILSRLKCRCAVLLRAPSATPKFTACTAKKTFRRCFWQTCLA